MEEPSDKDKWIHSSPVITPRPDPTTLTTAALAREINALRDIIETRLVGYDKAITLLQNNFDKAPSINEVDHKVDFVKELIARNVIELEKRIVDQFTALEKRTLEKDRDGKDALAAALQAAEKAVGKQSESFALATGKSEASMMKQIEQLVVLINSNVYATNAKIDQLAVSVNDKFDDLKDRVSAIESRIGGMEGTGKGAASLWGYIVAAITIAVLIGREFVGR